MNVQIFISYRREDTASEAGRIYSTIRQVLGEGLVFMDTSSIPPGAKWPEEIQAALKAAKTVVVVIGPAWLRAGSSDWGERRIDQKDDWVRQELSCAFKDNKIVIPVLVQGARMPPAGVLPNDINMLPDRQKLDIRHDYWDNDIKLLLDQLQGPSSNTQRGNTLADLRRAMLAARSSWELRRIFYELERFLAQDPLSPEGRLLKDRLEVAIKQAERREKSRPMALPAIRLALLVGFICLLIGIGVFVIDWQPERSDSCLGVFINISEPRDGEHVSSKVDVSGTSTVHKTCRHIFLVVRDRSAPIWKITNIGEVSTNGQWKVQAKLDEISSVGGDVEITARVTAQPTAYRLGESFPIPPVKGIPSNIVHVRRIQ